MNIQHFYNLIEKTQSVIISRLFYKVFKLIVNVFYPLCSNRTYGVDANSNIIISLTTFPERINEVYKTIETILHQSVKPQRIILWLAEDQFPDNKLNLPKNLIDLEKYGLDIRFCDNLYPHKKYYYSMLEYPDSCIITIDDDIFYPENLIEELDLLSRQYPGCICCTWAHEIVLDNKSILPYSSWKHCIKYGNSPSNTIIPIGCGGVLYPPRSLSNMVFNKEDIVNLCLRTDDIWLKFMAVLNGSKAVRWNKKSPIFFSNIKTEKTGLFHRNIGDNKNDETIKLLLQKYPEVFELLNDK